MWTGIIMLQSTLYLHVEIYLRHVKTYFSRTMSLSKTSEKSPVHSSGLSDAGFFPHSMRASNILSTISARFCKNCTKTMHKFCDIMCFVTWNREINGVVMRYTPICVICYVVTATVNTVLPRKLPPSYKRPASSPSIAAVYAAQR